MNKSQRWVVKLGSSLVTNDGRGLDQAAIADWAEQIVALREQGDEVVLVSSGSIAEGVRRLDWKSRPHALNAQQAAAAVGQMGLVQAYESCFKTHGLHAAQILLTHDDLVDRRRYLNARSTLRTLLQNNVVPVVNENDTVASEEIRFGDNDTLAALVANLIEANTLVILTDQEGVFDKDPKTSANAKLISSAQANDPKLTTIAGPSVSGLGRGGMITKISAAKRAARSGARTIIAGGRTHQILTRLRRGESLGTCLLPDQAPLVARKQWLASQLSIRGQVQLDLGAAKALLDKNSSLLPVGVITVSGNFSRGELVACVDPENREIARGLVNYSAEESHKIIGKASADIETILGYLAEPELIHRDNLVITA